MLKSQRDKLFVLTKKGKTKKRPKPLTNEENEGKEERMSRSSSKKHLAFDPMSMATINADKFSVPNISILSDLSIFLAKDDFLNIFPKKQMNIPNSIFTENELSELRELADFSRNKRKQITFSNKDKDSAISEVIN